jgi:arylsulfatase A-like enzyme
MLTRRRFAQTIAGGAAALRFARAAAPPLNFVFIIADQHSGIAMPQAGDHIAKVPQLNRLAGQGVTFTNAFTAGMSCAPSRASLDTGLHVQTHGVRNNGIPLRAETPSIHQSFERNGFIVSSRPRGYAEYLKALGYEDVVSPIIGSKRMAKLIETPYKFETGRAGFAPGHQLDGYATDCALRFLEENRDNRFVCWLQLHGAHDPFVAPPPFDSMYDPAKLPLPAYKAGEYDRKPPRQKAAWKDWQHADQLSDAQIRTILAHYYGMVSHTDYQVGRVLDQLSHLGLDQNTVVIYTADHGDCMGRHRMFTKGFCFYEPAVRIPLIIRAPGLPAGRTVDRLVSGVDVAPTILDLLRLPPLPNPHGRSLVRLARGENDDWKDIVYGGQGFEGSDRAVMVRNQRYKFARYDDGGVELYDLERDPDELESVDQDPAYAKVRREIEAELVAWDRRHPHAPPSFSRNGDADRQAKIKQAFEAWMASQRQ